MRRASRHMFSFILASTTLYGAHAGAQADAVDAAVEREVIFVTARGRAEDPFATPETANVFGALDIRSRRLLSLDAVADASPSFLLINDQDPGTNIVSVRGVATDRLQAPSIAYLVDGAALGDTEFFTGRLYDVARIETLAGPQGALFGVNAAGGALNVVTNAPTATPEGMVRVGYGSAQTRELDAAYGGTLSERVRARLAFSGFASDGHIRNTTLQRRVDGYESFNARLRVEADVAANILFEGRLEHREEDGGAAFASSNDVTGGFGGRLDGAALIDPIGDYRGRSDRFWTTAAGRLTRTNGDGSQTSLLVARDWYAKRWEEELDYLPGAIPGFPNGIQPVRQPTRLDVWTAEARHVSPDDRRLRWIAGGFVQDIERGRVDDFGPLLFGAPAPRYDVRSTNLAAFGQIDYDVTDAVTLSAALRYDADIRSQTITSAGALLDDREETFDAWQPKLSLRWRVNDDFALYATYAEAFRTGGFNPAPVRNLWTPVFEPERHRAVELGAKWRGGPWGLEVDAAIFASRIENYQNYTFLEFQSVTLNVDEVEITGLEVAARAEPVDGLELSAGLAVQNAEIARFVSPDPFDSTQSRDYSGNFAPNVPRYSANVSAAYSWRAAELDWTARVDLHAQGETFYEIDNVLRSPPRQWADARLSAGRDDWEVAVWTENATDERWAVSAFGQNMLPLLVAIGPTDSFTVNAGRRWGVELTARF